MVNEQKVNRHGFQIKWLVDRIIPENLNDNSTGTMDISPQAFDFMDKLIHVSKDLSRRLKETRYVHLSEMCLTLLDIVKRIRSQTSRVDAQDLIHLAKLSAILKKTFGRDDEDSGENDDKSETDDEPSTEKTHKTDR